MKNMTDAANFDPNPENALGKPEKKSIPLLDELLENFAQSNNNLEDSEKRVKHLLLKLTNHGDKDGPPEEEDYSGDDEGHIGSLRNLIGRFNRINSDLLNSIQGLEKII